MFFNPLISKVEQNENIPLYPTLRPTSLVSRDGLTMAQQMQSSSMAGLLEYYPTFQT